MAAAIGLGWSWCGASYFVVFKDYAIGSIAHFARLDPDLLTRRVIAPVASPVVQPRTGVRTAFGWPRLWWWGDNDRVPIKKRGRLAFGAAFAVN